MSASLITAGAILCMASGVPALVAGRRGVRASTIAMIIGALTGLAGCAAGLMTAPTALAARWLVPNGAFRVAVDPLSAFFTAPVFLLAGAGSLYAERYWPAGRGHAKSLRCFFGLMTGALAFVMIAAQTILFLAAWEIVAVSSFFLIATEHEQAQTRQAAWLYLAASHTATLALFALLTLLHTVTRSWAFAALPHGIATQPAGRAIFVLALVAFGIKAGLMPFHVWLPGAHAAAPSHVSAVMSGVVIKMGIYGLFRVLSLFDATPPAFGATLLALGMLSSILGVAFALAQHDIKRLLAYHSIENIGIITTGLGIGLLARAHGAPGLALLGYAGGLLHVWNHGLFKALLFLSAGSAVHETHTREMDRMGGLARVMPWTASAFLLGAVAICGLPPLNGFVSEWLLYVASFTSISHGGGWTSLLLVFVAPALALTGALALACFVKVFGIVFLGLPRTAAAAGAHEVPASMRAAMLPLGLACIAIGVAPRTLSPLLARVVSVAASQPGRAAELAALLRPVQLSAIAIAVVGAAAIAALGFATRKRVPGPTWDCGYARPLPRMQYTASSFARSLVGLFGWVMLPIVHAPRQLPLFPSTAAFESSVPDTVLDRALLPVLRRAQWVLAFARYVQSGRVQLYLLYLGATLVVLLAWSAQ